MDFTAISTALDSKLATLPGLPGVAWQNTDFDFDANVTYFRPQNILGAGLSVGLGDSDSDIYNGNTYQVDIFIPKDEGVKQATDWAKDISALFPKGLELNTAAGKIRIKTSDLLNAQYNVGSHYQTQLMIHYVLITP